MPHRTPVASLMAPSVAGRRPVPSASTEDEPPAGVVKDHRSEPAHLIGPEQAGGAGRAPEPDDPGNLRVERVPGARPRPPLALRERPDSADGALPDPGMRAGQGAAPGHARVH